jgi:transposase
MSKTMLEKVAALKARGHSESYIAEQFGVSVTEIRLMLAAVHNPTNEEDQTMITPERQAEIDEANAENPVDLTSEEEAELRMRNKNRFQMEVGAGKYRLQAKEGTRAAKTLQMAQAGYPANDIATALGIEPDSVRRILERLHP